MMYREKQSEKISHQDINTTINYQPMNSATFKKTTVVGTSHEKARVKRKNTVFGDRDGENWNFRFQTKFPESGGDTHIEISIGLIVHFTARQCCGSHHKFQIVPAWQQTSQ
jgi:hypothetical protein